MTCFNPGQYPDEAVESVLAQSLEDYEILIVDDGSTDPATQSPIATYSRPNTQVFRTPNRGLGAARNFLLARARGVYVSAVHAHGRFHPRYLEKTVPLLETDPSLTFVSTHLEMFGDEDRLWPDDLHCDLVTLLDQNIVAAPALVRRSAVVDAGGYDEAMPHQSDVDWELWLRLVAGGARGTILPDVLFCGRGRGSMREQCTAPQPHLELLEYMVRKHSATYRENVIPLLLRKEERIARTKRTSVVLEAERADLASCLDARRRRLELLREKRRLSPPAPRAQATDDLLQEYRRALHEVSALRSSWSWQVTAPLRRCYDLLFREKRGQ